MANHRIYVSDLTPQLGAAAAASPGLEIVGEEAKHAVRVKRLAVGDPVILMDGRGRTLEGPISEIAKDRRSGEWTLRVSTAAGIEVHPKPAREVHVVAAAPQGDRLDEMIDGLSQVGATRWCPLLCRRAVVDPRPTKFDRLDRIATEAMKQCGRSWKLEIGDAVALKNIRTGPSTVVADASGEPCGLLPAGVGPLLLVVGPEGGFAPEELELLRRSGCTISRFGPHILRIETAAIVAAAHLCR